MRPRTPSIGSKSSQPAKGPRTCGTSWSAPLQDSLNPQPDSSLKFGNVWHVIPVPPCHNLDKDSANKEGQMASLQVHIHFDSPPQQCIPSQELLSEITPSMKPGTLELLKNKLTEVSVEEAAGVVCTAALQKSNFVRHVCSLLCKDEPSYAKLVLLELQQQFERRHCHDEACAHACSATSSNSPGLCPGWELSELGILWKVIGFIKRTQLPLPAFFSFATGAAAVAATAQNTIASSGGGGRFQHYS